MNRISKFKLISIAAPCFLCVCGYAQIAMSDPTINVCSNNAQNGHGNKQSIHCDIYNFVPDPAYTLVETKPPVRNPGGSYTVDSVIHIDSSYRPGNMVVIARGDSVIAVSAACIGCALDLNLGSLRASDGSLGDEIENPFGNYAISETLRELKSHVETRVLFNVHVNRAP